jgi:hypothetical protein
MALVIKNTINNAIANIGDNKKIQLGLSVICFVMNVTNMTGIFNCSAQASIETKCVFDQTSGDYLCSNIESAYEALCALGRNPDLHLADGNLWQALIIKAYTVMEPVSAKITAQGVKYLDSAESSLFPDELYVCCTTQVCNWYCGVTINKAGIVLHSQCDNDFDPALQGCYTIFG